MRKLIVHHVLYGIVDEVPSSDYTIITESLLAGTKIHGHQYCVSVMTVFLHNDLQDENPYITYAVCVDNGDLLTFGTLREAVGFLTRVMRDHVYG